MKVTWTQAAAWRVQRHHLDRRAPAGSMLAVASRLCGLHAQLMSSAELTVWARVEDLDRQAVQRALWQDRTLVKTWAMRGTLHLLPAGELPLWQAVLGTSPRFLKPIQWKKHFGITLDELDAVTAAIGVALRDRIMTREELAREVKRLTGSGASAEILAQNSWGTILRPAAFSGHLCFAPSVGQRVRFTCPDTWLNRRPSPQRDATPEAAQADVTRRFLAAYGPATCHDLARWWNGGGVSTARQWIAALRDEVSPVDLEGAQAWILTAHLRELRQSAPTRSVRLLPGFDQYVVAASHHAHHLLPGDLRSRVYRPQGWISPVLLVNGRMHGTWRHELKGKRLEVAIQPFVNPPLWVRRATACEAERLAAFFDSGLNLTWNS